MTAQARGGSAALSCGLLAVIGGWAALGCDGITTGRSDAPATEEGDAGARGTTPAVDGGADGDLQRTPRDGGPTSPPLEADGSTGPAPATPDGEVPDGASAPPSDGGCPATASRFVTGVTSHWFGPGQNLGQASFPAPMLGPPHGGGACAGSTDTVSLGNGGWVVVEFGGNEIVDGPGPDFIVFENPFGVDCDATSVFAELGTVAVSEDGETWSEFPCTAISAPYGTCSGYHPVFADPDTNDLDPTDPEVAGGDAYDLADLGVSHARYVRVTDRADITGQAGVYDLDAVAIVNARCE